jgi:DNA repair protein RecO
MWYTLSMEQIRDLAIVLRSIAYEERHRIVTALTENHGQVSALARNAIQSRRFGGTLEPFAAAEWHFAEKPGAELVRLDEAHIRRDYQGLRADFDSLSMASAFNEFMLRLAPRNEPCPELFKLLSNALAVVEETPGAGRNIALLNAFLSKLLQWSGSQPQLGQCFGCHKALDAADPSDCRSNERKHSTETRHLRVTPAAIRDFETGLSIPIRQAGALLKAGDREHRELFRFIEALLVYHVPGFDKNPLKSLRFLDLESSVVAG